MCEIAHAGGAPLPTLARIMPPCRVRWLRRRKGRIELMARERKPRKRDIENYAHTDKERVNNPPVGLVTPETDKDAARKTCQHDPHIDPQLS